MSDLFVYDPSNEKKNFRIPGLQHKYRETVLLFVAEDCHSICDWCFRKRLFEGEALEDDVVVDPKEALRYLREHKEVHSILMSGGDSLLAEPELIDHLISGMARMRHIHDLRFGTRALVHNPKRYARSIPRYEAKKVYIVLHIVRPEEIRPSLVKVIKEFPEYTFYVQTPLLRDINDDPRTLAEIWYGCAEAGMQPYYVFQCRPTRGNRRYALSLREGHDIFSAAQARCTGVVKPGRYVMSTGSGKWEIIGQEYDDMILRCHQGINPLMVGMIRRADPDQVWWDLPDGDPFLKDLRRRRRPHASGE
jgi:KamA family protein